MEHKEFVSGLRSGMTNLDYLSFCKTCGVQPNGDSSVLYLHFKDLCDILDKFDIERLERIARSENNGI